ncbi:hypothetical protein ACVDG5_018125 [Mesorhizobium sp. ORM6]
MTEPALPLSITACAAVMKWWKEHRLDVDVHPEAGERNRFEAEPDFVTTAREALVQFAADHVLNDTLGKIVESVKEQLSGLLPSEQVAAIGSKFHSGGIVGSPKPTLTLLTAGHLSPGDAVRLDETGRLAKAVAGSPYLGTLPAGTVFHEGYAEVPHSWVRDLDDVTRQNLMPKVFP